MQDLFHRQSRKRRIQANLYKDMTLQPGDKYYDMLYPGAERERQGKLDAKEREDWEKDQALPRADRKNLRA